ncbi:hypothetical protein PIROE2DRAFT_61696 [Piromyces sp. E2]|nr:hypothetical protein PIROE2DRAFT_61696 [Piromyces sp. E2]|eukprot:OUM62776.1 hypothetical protein PIROE2DRAFT_61696 [Piromyces sp. E2]
MNRVEKRNNNEILYNQEALNNGYVNPSIIRKTHKKSSLNDSDKAVMNKKKSKFKFLHINSKNENYHINHHENINIRNNNINNNNNNDYIINIDNDISIYSNNINHNKLRIREEPDYDVDDCSSINDITNYYINKRRSNENENISYYNNRMNQTNLIKKTEPLYGYDINYNCYNHGNNIPYDNYNHHKNKINMNKNIVINNYVNNKKSIIYKTNNINDNVNINDYYGHEITRNRVPVSMKKYPHQRSQSLEESVILFNPHNERPRHSRFYSNNDNENYRKNLRNQYIESISPYDDYDNTILYNNPNIYNNNERNFKGKYQRRPVETTDITVYNKYINDNIMNQIPKNENKNYINNINIVDDYKIPQFDIENDDIIDNTVQKTEYKNQNEGYDKNYNQSYASNANENINQSITKNDIKKKDSTQNQENNTEGEKSLKQILASIPPVSPYFINGKKSIRILSFNIFLRPPGIKNHDSDHKAMRLAYFCERIIHSFDIICLQEFFAYGSSRQSKFLAYAKNAGFEYSLTISSKNLLNTSIDSGLVIISRYPIIKSERLTFKRGIKTDRFYSKGALYARILCSPNKEINLFNTHLQSGISNSNNSDGVNLSDALVVTRCKQLMALKSFIDSCTDDSNGPILLAGDMNVNSRRSFKNGNDSEEYVLMKKILAGEWVAVINHHDTTTVSTASKSQSGHMNTVSKVIGGNKKFTDTVPRYKVTDLVYESYGKHPITKGDVESFETMKPTETILTSTSSLWTCLSVDYLFWMEHKESTNNQNANNPNNNYKNCNQYNIEKERDTSITINVDRTQVNKFLTPSREYTQLSDHYGLSSVINVN